MRALTAVALATALHPVVLVPGLESSQLWGRLTEEAQQGWWCSLVGHTYFKIWWGSPTILGKSCFTFNMQVRYDLEHGYRNQTGLEIKTTEMGDLRGVKVLNEGTGQPHIYADFIQGLEDNGYVAGKDLHGAAYDWRMSPVWFEQEGNLYSQLKGLIERTVEANGSPAIVISHSFGGVITHDFLTRFVPDGWVQQHIKELVFMAPAWGGSAMLWQNFVEGQSLGPLLGAAMERTVSVTMPVSTYLSPQRGVADLWDSVDWLVRTDTGQHFRAEDFGAFLEMVGKGPADTKQALLMLEDHEARKVTIGANRKHPGAKTHILYSGDVHTPTRFEYKVSFDAAGEDELKTVLTPLRTHGHDGDGTLTALSVELYELWEGSQADVHPKVYSQNIEHQTFLTHLGVIADVLEIVNAANGPSAQIQRMGEALPSQLSLPSLLAVGAVGAALSGALLLSRSGRRSSPAETELAARTPALLPEPA